MKIIFRIPLPIDYLFLRDEGYDSSKLAQSEFEILIVLNQQRLGFNSDTKQFLVYKFSTRKLFEIRNN